MSEVVVAEHVSRAYGESVALDGVSLSVRQGEVFALLGPNGAGKTTLVRALTGTTDAEGTVRLFGAPPRAVAGDRIGLLPQEFAPHDRLSARELLAYYAGLYGEARDVEAVLADVGLADDADTWYENLSGGQRRRACVGTALVNDPDLLVLDEPTAGVDPAGRRALRGLLGELADGGTTILFTTHYVAEAERLADRAGLLADGRLVACDAPGVLVDEHGGPSRLLVGIDAPDGAAVPDLAGYRTEFARGTLAVYGVSPEDIGDVVSVIRTAGLEYDSLTWRGPSLEDAYMELTGRAGGKGKPAGLAAEPTVGGGRP